MVNTPWLSDLLSYIAEEGHFIMPYLQLVWEVIRTWWWVPLPFILFPVFKFHWRFWRVLLWSSSKKPMTLLEIRIPGEIVKPMRAMETVLTGFWQIYSDPNWFETWWEGQTNLNFSLEIAAIEGVPHFLICIPEKQRDIFESHIYAQYPEAEIEEVEDYTKKVPQDIPNSNWDMWGADYEMKADHSLPIKTYADFETERETMEEKRIDPMAALMEGLSKLGPGEQIWFQIVAEPVTDKETGFIDKAKKKYEGLAGRKPPPPKKPFLKELVETAIHTSPQKEESGGDDSYPEMKLTPGEKEVVRGIERKMSKPIFQVFMRHMYVARRESFNGRRIKVPISYINEFNTNHMNRILPWSRTITKVKRNWYDWFWFQKRRLYLRKRAMFRYYTSRDPAFDPLPPPEATFILNVEELASLYHFPSQVAAPPSVIQRVGSKKREAPRDLPREE